MIHKKKTKCNMWHELNSIKFINSIIISLMYEMIKKIKKFEKQ